MQQMLLCFVGLDKPRDLCAMRISNGLARAGSRRLYHLCAAGQQRGASITYAQQREELGKKIDALDVDARREWAERKSELDRELAELGRDIDGALDSFGDDVTEATH